MSCSACGRKRCPTNWTSRLRVTLLVGRSTTGTHTIWKCIRLRPLLRLQPSGSWAGLRARHARFRGTCADRTTMRSRRPSGLPPPAGVRWSYWWVPPPQARPGLAGKQCSPWLQPGGGCGTPSTPLVPKPPWPICSGSARALWCGSMRPSITWLPITASVNRSRPLSTPCSPRPSAAQCLFSARFGPPTRTPSRACPNPELPTCIHERGSSWQVGWSTSPRFSIRRPSPRPATSPALATGNWLTCCLSWRTGS